MSRIVENITVLGNLIYATPVFGGQTTLAGAFNALNTSIWDITSAGTGLLVETSAGVYTAVSVTAGTGITVANGSGVLGAPTVTFNGNTAVVSPPVLGASNVQAALNALATAQSPISTLSGTGYVVQTATNTFALQSMTAGAGISITNPSGVGGSTFAVNATTVPVTSVFGGQTTLQTALNALNTNIWPISSAGTGILVSTGSGTYSTVALTAGTNIAIANANGSTGSPTIAFTPTGGAPAIPAAPFAGTIIGNINTGLDPLVWNRSNAWVGASTMPTTTAVVAGTFEATHCMLAGNGEAWNISGPKLTTYGIGWGFTSTAPTGQGNPFIYSICSPANTNDYGNPSAMNIQSYISYAGSMTAGSTFMRAYSASNSAYGGDALGVVNEIFYVDGAGNVGILNNVKAFGSALFVGTCSASSYITTSSRASKRADSIEPLDGYMANKSGKTAYDMIKQISPVAFLYNTDDDTRSDKRSGFIADDVQKLGPGFEQAVSTDAQGNPEGMIHNEVNTLLLSAFQQLQSKFEQLQSDFEALRNSLLKEPAVPSGSLPLGRANKG